MGRRLTTEQAVERLREALGGFYDFSRVEWKGSTVPVTITCPLHGTWHPHPGNIFYNRGSGCFGCNKRKFTEEDKWLALEGKLRCRDCGVVKETNLENFPARDGWYRLQCRPCLAGHETRRRREKAEEIQAKDRARWPKRREYHMARMKADYHRKMKDPEYVEKERARNRARAKRDVGKWRAIVSIRRVRKLQATPLWLSEEDKQAMRDIYIQAAELTRGTGIRYNVDHIVPLTNDRVCGLHVPWNLQIIPAWENLSKGNRFDEAEALGPARMPDNYRMAS
jgi:hypothetical protein